MIAGLGLVPTVFSTAPGITGSAHGPPCAPALCVHWYDLSLCTGMISVVLWYDLSRDCTCHNSLASVICYNVNPPLILTQTPNLSARKEYTFQVFQTLPSLSKLIASYREIEYWIDTSKRGVLYACIACPVAGLIYACIACPVAGLIYACITCLV